MTEDEELQYPVVIHDFHVLEYQEGGLCTYFKGNTWIIE